jgi:hypothetical protein
MSSSDAIRRPATDSGSNPADRAALIEQLLLAGLDQYFAGEYEQAIHVWTRVFFLDRGHARARAYIERARGALGERQREAEAQGLDDTIAIGPATSAATSAAVASRVVAVSSRAMGESATARALVPRRLSRRDLLLGSSDVLIEDGIELDGDFRGESKEARAEAPGGTRLRTHVVLVTLAVVLLCGAAYLVVDRDRVATWWRMSADTGTHAPVVMAEPLSVPRASEQALARAHTMFERGRLHEALQALTPIRLDDPLRRDADLLLAEIERALLESAGVSLPPPITPPAPATAAGFGALAPAIAGSSGLPVTSPSSQTLPSR